MKAKISKLFVFLVAMILVVTPVSAQPDFQQPTPGVGLDGNPNVDLRGESQEGSTVGLASPNFTGSYIVLLEGESLATYKGEISGYDSPVFTEGGTIDVEASPAQSYLTYVNNRMNTILTTASQTLQRELVVDYRYDVILNGFAAKMSPEEAERIALLPGVRGVYRDELSQIETDVSPEFIGATKMWDGTAATLPGTKGEGMLVGILDTGINMDHPSFAATGGDGYVHTNPFGSGVYKGLCAADPGNYVCNNKLVSVWAYTDDSELLFGEDANGHGSHTASTAAGNYLSTTFSGVATAISGIAPHANIIAYDVCDSSGCAWADTAAAVQQAILDGVDVLNYSIGPNAAVNSYQNPADLAFLEAMKFGILTVTSAGNSGPLAKTVYKSPAWSLVVANSTHGRIFKLPVKLHESGSLTILVDAIAQQGNGPALSSDLLNNPIKYNTTNVLGCAAFPAGYFTGTVALIQRGTCTFPIKVNFAAAAGAVAVIVINNVVGPPTAMPTLESTTIPSMMVEMTSGNAIRDALTATSQVDIHSTVSSHSQANWKDLLSASSSRGPYPLFDVLQPNISAPGTSVLAAYNTLGDTAPYGGVGPTAEIGLMTGTSMASPHAAGAAVLMMDLFPSWSTQEIKSALIMSAYDQTTLKDDMLTPTDPFDDGNGRIDLTKAALIGLVMEETTANFIAANPAHGGDVRKLNLPSYQNSSCAVTCVFSRKVRNVTGITTNYSVVTSAGAGVTITSNPTSFSIAPGATQIVEFTVDVSLAPMSAWRFGSITFDTSAIHSAGKPITAARFPVAVMPSTTSIPKFLRFDSFSDSGSATITSQAAIPITSGAVYKAGLVKANRESIILNPDTTAASPFDDLSQVFVKKIVVPALSIRLVVEISATTANDLNMYLFWDKNGNGTLEPSTDTLVSLSATDSAYEYLNGPYDWIYYTSADTFFLVVQNYQGSSGDSVTLASAVVPYNLDNQNFNVSIPSTNPAFSLFSITTSWSESMIPGDRLYGYFSICFDALCSTRTATDLDVVRKAGIFLPLIRR